jgi:hypothetical protein
VKAPNDKSTGRVDEGRTKTVPYNLWSDKVITIFWIGITISLIVAIVLAYRDMVVPYSYNPLDHFLPKYDSTRTAMNTTLSVPVMNTTLSVLEPTDSGTENIPSTTVPISPESMRSPFIPRFVAIWGYIGAAAYVLKVTTIKMQKGTFRKVYIPNHIANLFIGVAAAIVVYFILSTGGFFGLTIDFTKVSNPSLIPFVYGAVAFFSGYSVRHIISIISGIIDNVFLHDRRGKTEEQHMKDQGDKSYATTQLTRSLTIEKVVDNQDSGLNLSPADFEITVIFTDNNGGQTRETFSGSETPKTFNKEDGVQWRILERNLRDDVAVSSATTSPAGCTAGQFSIGSPTTCTITNQISAREPTTEIV